MNLTQKNWFESARLWEWDELICQEIYLSVNDRTDFLQKHFESFLN